MLRNTDESWTSRGKTASQEQVHYIQVHRVRYTRTEGQLTNLQGEITFTDTRGLIHQSIISLRADGLTSGWRISFPLSTSSSPEWHIISSDLVILQPSKELQARERFSHFEVALHTYALSILHLSHHWRNFYFPSFLLS